MLSESSYVTYRVLQTEKVTGLKIKLIPNPSCWLYFGRKWFSHWRQNWIFIMGFEMDPKSSELHIWSKNMVTIKFLLSALALSSSLCWALNGVFSWNDPTCENKSANEAKAAAHSTETWGGDYISGIWTPDLVWISADAAEGPAVQSQLLLLFVTATNLSRFEFLFPPGRLSAGGLEGRQTLGSFGFISRGCCRLIFTWEAVSAAQR